MKTLAEMATTVSDRRTVKLCQLLPQIEKARNNGWAWREIVYALREYDLGIDPNGKNAGRLLSNAYHQAKKAAEKGLYKPVTRRTESAVGSMPALSSNKRELPRI
ncbi:hypothetical protein [Sulfuricystis thermophila]|uniref:hypothetical protein n=1 Tax=Sulfuricystis thermophila TaxID=2496847 RepID=UPI0010366826|nr:hypothetical protein [Sulfuricystis thermophila]